MTSAAISPPRTRSPGSRRDRLSSSPLPPSLSCPKLEGGCHQKVLRKQETATTATTVSTRTTPCRSRKRPRSRSVGNIKSTLPLHASLSLSSLDGGVADGEDGDESHVHNSASRSKLSSYSWQTTVDESEPPAVGDLYSWKVAKAAICMLAEDIRRRAASLPPPLESIRIPLHSLSPARKKRRNGNGGGEDDDHHDDGDAVFPSVNSGADEKASGDGGGASPRSLSSGWDGESCQPSFLSDITAASWTRDGLEKPLPFMYDEEQPPPVQEVCIPADADSTTENLVNISSLSIADGGAVEDGDIYEEPHDFNSVDGIFLLLKLVVVIALWRQLDNATGVLILKAAATATPSSVVVNDSIVKAIQSFMLFLVLYGCIVSSVDRYDHVSPSYLLDSDKQVDEPHHRDDVDLIELGEIVPPTQDGEANSWEGNALPESR